MRAATTSADPVAENETVGSELHTTYRSAVRLIRRADRIGVVARPVRSRGWASRGGLRGRVHALKRWGHRRPNFLQRRRHPLADHDIVDEDLSAWRKPESPGYIAAPEGRRHRVWEPVRGQHRIADDVRAVGEGVAQSADLPDAVLDQRTLVPARTLRRCPRSSLRRSRSRRTAGAPQQRANLGSRRSSATSAAVLACRAGHLAYWTCAVDGPSFVEYVARTSFMYWSVGPERRSVGEHLFHREGRQLAGS